MQGDQSKTAKAAVEESPVGVWHISEVLQEWTRRHEVILAEKPRRPRNHAVVVSAPPLGCSPAVVV